MNNKETLKELALEIRKFKNSRKQASPDHGKYNIDALPWMSYEARLRSIIQALKNRRIPRIIIDRFENDELLQGYVKGLGIEDIRPDTEYVSWKKIIQYMDEDIDDQEESAA